MAIKKSKELKNGVVGEYWRVHQINIIDGVCHVGLACYLNKAARTAGKDIMDMQTFTYPVGFAAQDMDIKNPIKIAYEKIKESRMEKAIITPAVSEVKDISGAVVTPAVVEVSEMREMNEFVSGVDV